MTADRFDALTPRDRFLACEHLGRIWQARYAPRRRIGRRRGDVQRQPNKQRLADSRTARRELRMAVRLSRAADWSGQP